MSNRVLRWVVVLVAVAALAGGSFKAWDLERQAALERTAADTFLRDALKLSASLSDLRSAVQAYVADGQISETWQKAAATILQSVTSQAAALVGVVRSPEGQGAVESIVESAAAIAKTEARAREFLAASQRLSASDVVFSDASPHIAKATAALDVALRHERAFLETTLQNIRLQQATYLAGAAGLALLALLLLAPLPRLRPAPAVDADAGDTQPGSGLGIGHVSSNRPVTPASDEPFRLDRDSISLADTAAVCLDLARVHEPRELPALLERAASALHAGGIVVWMPDGPNGSLRPALAHGYSPVTISRMGTLPVEGDTATAVAFRTRTAQVVPADLGGPGAVAVPLVTADGCSGVMSAEIQTGTPADEASAAASIIAAQLAMLISPSTGTDARTP